MNAREKNNIKVKHYEDLNLQIYSFHKFGYKVFVVNLIIYFQNNYLD